MSHWVRFHQSHPIFLCSINPFRDSALYAVHPNPHDFQLIIYKQAKFATDTTMGPLVENIFIHESERSRASAVWNLRLRLLTIFVMLVAFGLQVAVAVESTEADNFEIWVSPESFVFVSIPLTTIWRVEKPLLTAQQIGISLFWNITEFVVRFIRKRGMHPGAHVAFDLMAWAGLFSAGLIQVLVNGWSAFPVAAGSLKLLGWYDFAFFWLVCARLSLQLTNPASVSVLSSCSFTRVSTAIGAASKLD